MGARAPVPRIVNGSHNLLLNPCRFRWYVNGTTISEPVYLEGGRSYYFKYVSSHTRWFHVGLAVKMHCLNFTSRPYVGDHEKQIVVVTSTAIKEKQVRKH
jgi:hypothetical protein